MLFLDCVIHHSSCINAMTCYGFTYLDALPFLEIKLHPYLFFIQCFITKCTYFNEVVFILVCSPVYIYIYLCIYRLTILYFCVVTFLKFCNVEEAIYKEDE